MTVLLSLLLGIFQVLQLEIIHVCGRDTFIKDRVALFLIVWFKCPPQAAVTIVHFKLNI